MFHITPEFESPGSASNELARPSLDGTLSPVRLPSVYETGLGVADDTTAVSFRVRLRPLVSPVRVEGKDLVIDDTSMNSDIAYPIKYRDKEYLIRKRDANIIDIYVVK